MDDALRERAESLIAGRELSDHEIGRRLGISHETVRRWRRQMADAEAGRPRARLRRGERRLAEPIRCSQGHLITIVPCRTCHALAQAAGDRAARQAGLIASGPPDKRRAVKQAQLDQRAAPLERWRKPPGWRQRLAECRDRKRRRGEPGT